MTTTTNNTTKYKDSEKDYCYCCGHQLGDHRMSGRCNRVITGFRIFEVCKCQQYQFKEIVSLVVEEEDLR